MLTLIESLDQMRCRKTYVLIRTNQIHQIISELKIYITLLHYKKELIDQVDYMRSIISTQKGSTLLYNLDI
jgi:hypothetical protein